MRVLALVRRAKALKTQFGAAILRVDVVWVQ